MHRVIIIIPTLNEEKNITILHKKIKKNKIKSDILFIDDNSSDNTRLEILSLKKKYSNIYFIFRGHKMGIGSAHKDGFKWAYKKNIILQLQWMLMELTTLNILINLFI